MILVPLGFWARPITEVYIDWGKIFIVGGNPFSSEVLVAVVPLVCEHVVVPPPEARARHP